MRRPPADELITIYGATFEHVAGPTRPIEGIVRDIDTRKPLAGIMVRGERSLGRPDRYVQAITDAQGHYRLVGLPRGREGNVRAVAPVDFPRRGYGDSQGRTSRPAGRGSPLLAGRHQGRRAGRDRADQAGYRPQARGLGDRPGHRGGHRQAGPCPGRILRLRRTILIRKTTPLFGRRCPTITTRGGMARSSSSPSRALVCSWPMREGMSISRGRESMRSNTNRRYRYLEAYPNGIVPSEHHVVAEIDPAPGTVSMNRDLLLATWPVLDRHRARARRQTPLRQ